MPPKKPTKRTTVGFPSWAANITQHYNNLPERDDPASKDTSIISLAPGPFGVVIDIPKHEKFDADVLAFDIALDGSVVARLCVPQAQIESVGRYINVIFTVTRDGVRKRLEAYEGLREISVKMSKGTGGRSDLGDGVKANAQHWMEEPSGRSVEDSPTYDSEGKLWRVEYVDQEKVRFEETEEGDTIRFKVAEKKERVMVWTGKELVETQESGDA